MLKDINEIKPIIIEMISILNGPKYQFMDQIIRRKTDTDDKSESIKDQKDKTELNRKNHEVNFVMI